MTVQRRRVLYTYLGSDPVELAVFAFDGQRVLSTYRNGTWEAMFNRGFESSVGRISPADGATFFEHLPDALIRSSTLIVEDVA